MKFISDSHSIKTVRFGLDYFLLKPQFADTQPKEDNRESP